MKKLYASLLCITLLANHTPLKSYSDDDTFTKGLIGTGCAIAAGVAMYGLGCCCGWWGQPSDDQLIQTAEDALQHTHKLQQAVDTMYAAGDDETSLYALANNPALRHTLSSYFNGSSSTYVLTDAINKCQKSINALSARCIKLQQQYTLSYRERSALQSMQHYSKTLQMEVDRLTQVKTYLERHKRYFELLKSTEALAHHYSTEYALIVQQTDCCTLIQAIEAHAERAHNGRFALLSYTAQLKADLQSLKRDFNRTVAGIYPHLFANMRTLMQALEQLHSFIISDNNYKMLVIEKERYEQEQERLRLERERLRLEQERARAEKERLRLERKREEARQWHLYYPFSLCDNTYCDDCQREIAKRERERAAQERRRLERERERAAIERQRLENQRRENERYEQEQRRKTREQEARRAEERARTERAEAERARERAAYERQQAERERRRLEQERQERERIQNEERKRAERERQERERKAHEERERKEREERERKEKERKKREKKEREERERLEHKRHEIQQGHTNRFDAMNQF